MIYRAAVRASRWLGTWVVACVTFTIATGYFVLLPRRTGESIRFYRALLDGCSWWRAMACTWRQYQDFAHVFVERIETDFEYESDGWEHMREAREQGHGAVLVMSHFGRWQIAARLAAEMGLGLSVVMGTPQPRTRSDKHLPELGHAGVNVIGVAEGTEQPATILDAVSEVRAGGIVALSGDRALESSRLVRVPFLNGEVSVPIAPYVVAMVAGAPVLAVFAFKTAPKRYRFVCCPPHYLPHGPRAGRDSVLREAAASYLGQLHQMMLAHPEQWHAFGPFLQTAAHSAGGAQERPKR